MNCLTWSLSSEGFGGNIVSCASIVESSADVADTCGSTSSVVTDDSWAVRYGEVNFKPSYISGFILNDFYNGFLFFKYTSFNGSSGYIFCLNRSNMINYSKY